MKVTQHGHICIATTIANNEKLYQFCLPLVSSQWSLQTIGQMPIRHFNVCQTLGRNVSWAPCTECTSSNFNLHVQWTASLQTKYATFHPCFKFQKSIRQLPPVPHQIFYKKRFSICQPLRSDKEFFQLSYLPQQNPTYFKIEWQRFEGINESNIWDLHLSINCVI